MLSELGLLERDDLHELRDVPHGRRGRGGQVGQEVADGRGLNGVNGGRGVVVVVSAGA